VLGIQWHPERLFDSDARYLAPFRWVISARDPSAGMTEAVVTGGGTATGAETPA
jgi:gamma-glutamyl-gamma-aminobutyrate hydrolase PuuD